MAKSWRVKSLSILALTGVSATVYRRSKENAPAEAQREAALPFTPDEIIQPAQFRFPPSPAENEAAQFHSACVGQAANACLGKPAQESGRTECDST